MRWWSGVFDRNALRSTRPRTSAAGLRSAAHPGKRNPAIWLAIALILGACATAAEDETRYYLLPKPKPAERVVFTDDTVALRELDLPLYARAAEIAYVAADGAVAVSDDNRWADEPARAMTRALAGSLREAIGAPVVVEPWGRAIQPVLRIDVTVDRFIGTPGGEVVLTGDFRIVSLDDRKTITAQGFDIAAPTADAGFDALTRAHSVALARLSDEIVVAIREDAMGGDLYQPPR